MIGKQHLAAFRWAMAIAFLMAAGISQAQNNSAMPLAKQFDAGHIDVLVDNLAVDLKLLAEVNEGLATAETAGIDDTLNEQRFGGFGSREITLRDSLKYFLPILAGLLIAAFFFLVRQRERKKAERLLRVSEECFRKLIEHAPEAIMLADPNANWVANVNPAAERLFKMSAAELANIGPMELSPPTQPDGRLSSEKGEEFLARAMAGETPVFEWTHRDAEGRDIPCEVRLLRMEIGGRTVVRGSIIDITERKKTEAALEKSRRRFEQLVSSVEGIVWEADAQTIEFKFVSEQAERLLGYPVEKWMEPGFWVNHIHPADRAAATEHCMTCTRQGRNHDFEYRMLAADGRVVWLRDIATVLVEQGVPRLLCGIMVDITEQKRAEASLSTAAELTGSLIRSMQDGFCVLDENGVQSDVNPAFCEMTGFSREELIGLNAPYPYWPPEEYERIQAALTETLDGAAAHFELTFMRRNGERFPVIVSPSSVKNDTGETVSYCATVKDITELKRAQWELASTTDLLERTSRMAKVGGWELDLRTKELFWSTETFRIHEIEPTSPPSLDQAIAFYAPEARPIIEAKVKAGIEKGTPWDLELPMSTATGRNIWVRAQASAVEGEDGKVVKLVGTFQDITLRRHAQIEREALAGKMQETQRLESLGVLAGGIAHDFNNLLTAILGNVSVAQLKLPSDSSVQDCLGNINEASLRAADLCKQMLAYSGRGRFEIRTLDLGELVEQTTQMLQISINQKAVLRFHLQPGLPPVDVDPTQIRQVIMNLVINASEAIGETDGVISFSTGATQINRDCADDTLMLPDLPTGDYVCLEVSDSGPGMSEETQARIFDPFFTTKFAGRGLGLAAVQGIVRGHKGAMRVDSKLGYGTSFKLFFPASTGTRETAEETEEAQEASPAWQGQGVVLVVDDEEPARNTIARMMPLLGFDYVLAVDGREAITIFRANPAKFAIVLLDLIMPHIDGEQTFNELRQMRPDVPVVIMSGFNAHEALLRFKGKGLASFLQKPFTIATLRTTIHGILHGKESVPPQDEKLPPRGDEIPDDSLSSPFRQSRLPEISQQRLSEPETFEASQTILVIDDERMIRESTKTLLQSLGYEVLTASNGQDGIDVFMEHVGRVSMVLLDFRLPDMRADAVFQVLRQHSNVPVVLLTGFLASDVAETYQAMGFAATLEKPLPAESLCKLLQEILG
ncbi:hybrid sensor histidine kinase/response regulator [Rubripirellula reticaptiva]|uniref:hybrid sensor histidine kinase/response regulator n=1 Tax=Rubripirellula reticaptiva TaxID=2528013 RepID=UPI001648DEE1|nr:PAS domain S-box protein [Rubripirellula reticaptiva]